MYQQGFETHFGLIKLGSNFSAYGQPFLRLFHHFFFPINAGPSPCIEFLGWDLDSSPILRYDQFSLIPQYPIFIKTLNTHNTLSNRFLSFSPIFQVTCDHFIFIPTQYLVATFHRKFQHSQFRQKSILITASFFMLLDSKTHTIDTQCFTFNQGCTIIFIPFSQIAIQALQWRLIH